MNPSRLFVLRPVATTLLMVAVLLSGLIAWRFLSVSALPEVDYPTIQVSTEYPGASPEIMAATVTAPLEDQLGEISGLEEMASVSSGGASVITLQFSLTTSLDVAEQEVQAAINSASSLLPSDLPFQPVYAKINPADAPILTLAVTSGSLPLPKLYDLVNTRVAHKLAQVAGVGQVALNGQEPAVRVRANIGALAAAGLTMADVRSAITANNLNSSKGSFDGTSRSAAIDANDQLVAASDYGDLIIAWNDGAPLRLRDLATVSDGAQDTQQGAWANGTPAVLLSVQRQPGANVIATVAAIKNILPDLQDTLPNDVDIVVLTDRTTSIQSSVDDTEFELLLAIALVVMVTFLFLRNVSATLIPSAAVPLSLIGTLGVMYLAGFSLNNLSLMALVIATGFVIDDAIVMVENIARHLDEGKTPLQAALDGSRQIAFTIISLTISLIAVLIPLLFMGDVAGRLFREFAITLAVAILISGAVSLTLTPMLSARLLHHVRPEDEGPTARRIGAFIDRVIDRYAAALRVVLRHQGLTLLVAVGTLALTVVLYALSPKGFFPVQDTGILQGIADAPQSASYTAMAEHQAAISKVILADPDVESLSSTVGVNGSNPTLNTARFTVNLKPHGERDASATEVIERLRPELAELAGITVYLQPVQDLTTDTRVARTQYQFTLRDTDATQLETWVPQLVERLGALPELADVATDLQPHGRQAYLRIDRDAAARLGVTMSNLDGALYDAFGQRQISTIFTQAAQYRVVLEGDTGARDGLAALDAIYVPASDGTPIPLSALARVETRDTLLSISRISRIPAATVSFNLADGVALSDAVDAIRSAEADMDLPPSIQTAFSGAALAFEGSLSNMVFLILAAIVTMYIVLGVLYESFIHPITILTTLPSAGVGALLALLIGGHSIGIVAVIGIILLIGIVKKNAIMMIDFALEAERENGMTPEDAIYQACLLRFRPILMTTMAALLGALPLMLAHGAGAELRQPLGVAMVGGLLVSQVLTLFTTPVIYLYFDRLSARAQAWRERHFPQDAPA